jgi:hypothetical protein
MQPTRFKSVINMKAEKRLGSRCRRLLSLADELIE